MKIRMVPFGAAIEDVSRGNEKLPTAAFLEAGPFPVVDQGRRLVAGYADDERLLCKTPGPVIVFGDHTRAFKYIDFPFVMGADGVKVLRVREGWDPKYVFHYLRSRNIPSAGYSRHFKFLKELEVPQPPFEEQCRIASLLDQADALRAKRRQALEHLGHLAEAVFLHMFGDPVANPFDHPTRPLSQWVVEGSPITYGILKPGPDIPGGIPYIRVLDIAGGEVRADSVRRTSRTIAEAYARSTVAAGDLVISIRGHVGRLGVVPPELDGANITQDSARLRVPAAAREFVAAALATTSMTRWMAKRTKGAAVQGINLGDLRTAPIPVPPEEQVCAFEKASIGIREQIRAASDQVATMDVLVASLQSRAFRGQS